MADIDSISSYWIFENEFVNTKYYPENIKKKCLSLLNEVRDRIATLDSITVTVPVKNYQVNQLNQSFPNIFESGQTAKVVEKLFNLEPAPSNSNVSQNMTTIQPEYWKSPSIYDSPLYSDYHPPIMCNSKKEKENLLHNMYKVPPDLQNVLGGERVVSVYSNIVSDSPNEKELCIKSPFDIGFQRNQDPNSLYNLIKNRQIEVVEIKTRRRKNISGFLLFHIKIKNISHKRIQFCLQKGTVIDLPVTMQPLYIAETWNGFIDSFEEIETDLQWYCMVKELTLLDDGDPKLTPFVYVCPERYCKCPRVDIWNPNSDLWWDNVQPNRSGKKSKTNSIITIEKRIKKLKICSINHTIAIGGQIDTDLFLILIKKSSLYVSYMEGVVRYKYMTKPKDADIAMINTNQMGVVIAIPGNKYILIEKTDSGKWEGGYCTYDDYNEVYKYKNEYYYKDFSSIPAVKFSVENVMDAMKSDPQYFDEITYNSQHSRQYLFNELGINVPLIHSGQILVPSIHNLIDY